MSESFSPQTSACESLPHDPRRLALFLDIDGTLLEFAPRPDAVQVPQYLPQRLNSLWRRLEGAIALVSGRSVAEISAFFPDFPGPLMGHHGAERRFPGTEIEMAPTRLPDYAGLKARLSAWCDRYPGTRLEDKQRALALHYRTAPEQAENAVAFMQTLQSDCGAAAELIHGKFVIELRPAGCDKGSAIADCMCQRKFTGRHPVFVGDDVTDEFGFRQVNLLDGTSVKVGPGPTEARYRLADVEAVHDYLNFILNQDVAV